MTNSFNAKLAKLEKEKSELDISFLQSKKQEYEKRISELLLHPIHEWEEGIAITKFNEVRECYSKIWEINYKIDHIPETIEEIDKKISFYKEKREKVKEIPLFKNTEEWIAEIFWWDTLYQYAKEVKNENLIKKLEERSLTPNEYTTHLENMYKEILKEYEKSKKEVTQNVPKKTEILLPEWMSNQINEELKDNKEIQPQDIEKFLKKELKKNGWEIKISHIKNTFKDKSDQAYNYIKRIIADYPMFKISDKPRKNDLTVQRTPSKREKLISQASNQLDKKRNIELEKRRLISRLSSIRENEKLEDRVPLYVNLYEEIWCKFADWISFSNDLFNAINTYNHIDLEWEIQKNLTNIINNGLHPAKLEKYWYFAYKFGRSWDNWRIVLYPNGEIFTICSHGVYEKIIGTKPPIDKTK